MVDQNLTTKDEMDYADFVAATHVTATSVEDYYTSKIESRTFINTVTGDPEIDELERRMAAGEDIGIEDLEILEPKTEPVKIQPEDHPEAEEFSDDYSDLPANRR